MKRVVTRAEQLGFSSLWAGDHILTYSPILDPVVMLATAAAHTEFVSIGTAVYLLALRNPVVTAKHIGSLDYMSNGRLLFGVGLGGEVVAEWEACGVPRARRSALVDEAIDTIQAIWDPRELATAQNATQAEPVAMKPKPARSGGPPILVGGRTDSALRRASRNDGWIGYLMSPGAYKRCREKILAERQRDSDFLFAHLLYVSLGERSAARRNALEALGRRYRRSFDETVDRHCLIGSPEECKYRLDEYVDAGVEHIILSPLW